MFWDELVGKGDTGAMGGSGTGSGTVGSTGGLMASIGSAGGMVLFLAGMVFS
jgi:hypothetical protein